MDVVSNIVWDTCKRFHISSKVLFIRAANRFKVPDVGKHIEEFQATLTVPEWVEDYILDDFYSPHARHHVAVS